MLDQPLHPDGAARLLVGGAGEQDVAAQARDRVAGGVEAGRARLAGEQPNHRQLHRDHRLHVDRAAPVDVAVGDVGRERIVAPAIGRGRDDVEVRQQEERLAAGAVAAEPGEHAASAGYGFDDIGSRPSARSSAARWLAASVSGPGGSGGLIDGMRIRSRSSATSSSCAADQAPRVERARTAAGRPSGSELGAEQARR